MNIAIAQTRYKTGDFEFNLNSIKEKVLKTDAELVIFPEADLYEIGGKDLLLDRKVQDAQIDFYDRLAGENFECAILVGDILIQNGEVIVSDDGFFDINGEKAYIPLVGVLPAYRRRGIAKKLMLEAISYVNSKEFKVVGIHSNNPIAVKAYCDLGFDIIEDDERKYMELMIK